MADLETTVRAVLASSGDAGGNASPCPSAAEWEELLLLTPGPLHPWLADRAEHRFGAAAVPAGVRAAFAAAATGAAVGHLQRQALLKRLVPALDTAGVPFVVLKGTALAYLAYPDPSFRTMADVDLWTLPEHLDRAATALLDAGLRYATRFEGRTAAAARLDVAATRVFDSPHSPIVVELHSRLESLAGMSSGWLAESWRRRERRALGDLDACVLHPEDMLTHLVVHSSRYHRFECGVRPLVDIGLLIHAERARLSWPDLMATWRREGVETWALLTLALARDLAGAPIPAGVVTRFHDRPGFAELETLARRQVLGAGRSLPGGMERLLSPAPGDGTTWLIHRLTTWYWKGPAGHRRAPGEVLREAARRMRHDLLCTLPRYVRAVLDGTLRGPEFRRRREMTRGKGHLDALVAAADAARTGGARTA
jgi:hypothetical protein